MKIRYETIVKDDKVVEEQHFDNICCESMRKALLNQETPLGKIEYKELWLYCPFCQEEIIYLE